MDNSYLVINNECLESADQIREDWTKHYSDQSATDAVEHDNIHCYSQIELDTDIID